MTIGRLILQSVRYYWRSHLSVAIGAAVAAMVLVGALVVGDSVTYSLERIALLRLGQTQVALDANDRFFREALSSEAAEQAGVSVAPLLSRPAVAVTPTGDSRANQVMVYGVTEAFASFRPSAVGAADKSMAIPDADSDDVVLSENLASQLGVTVGDTVVLRVEKPSTLSRDMPLASDDDSTLALRLNVLAIADDSQFARFGLRANQVPPFNAFVSLSYLQKRMALEGRINMMIAGQVGQTGRIDEVVEGLNEAIQRNWQLADAELELRELATRNEIELRTRRVFLDHPVAESVGQIASKNSSEAPAPFGVLTYFVNELRLGDRATPYSVVSAIGSIGAGDGTGKPIVAAESFSPLATENLVGDSIVINQWLADDLQANVGDTVTVTYFVLGDRRGLAEAKRDLKITAIVPIEGLAGDRELMAAFPGIADADHCRDFSPGMPMNLDRVRDKDEAYWETYRGTPKAFVSLETGRAMWGNRFGDLTAVRFAGDATSKDAIESELLATMSPDSVGLTFRDVVTSALSASRDGIPFGGLFLGLSIFIVVAAVLLTAMLFVFGVEQRSTQIGTFLALGFRPMVVRRMMIGEGLALAAAGTVVGALAGLAYTKMVLLALSSVWQGAVASASIQWHAKPTSVLTGAAINVVVSLGAIWWSLRRQGERPARELLAERGQVSETVALSGKSSPKSLWLAIVLIIAAVGLALVARGESGKTVTMIFFSSGALLLVGALLFCRWLLRKVAGHSSEAALSVAGLATRNTTRRAGRSLATISMLACGVFLVVAIQSQRQTDDFDPDDRAAGTGGFALFAQSQLPVLAELNDPEDRADLNLDYEELEGTKFVPMRVRVGDDASCLNLNKAQRPQLVGVDSADLGPGHAKDRHAFSFAGLSGDVREMLPEAPIGENPWLALDVEFEDGSVPAIADFNTVTYALQKGIGDTITYEDERGNPFDVRIVGLVTDSILQGNILISQRRFVSKFPSASGHQMFLIRVDEGDPAEVSAILSRELADFGMQVTPAVDRFAAFAAVTNTYLTIFQALGGLGLLLGSVGLGVVVLRNVLERRGELAVLSAVGWGSGQVRRAVFTEHSVLLIAGLCVGVIAAGVAVAPAVNGIAEALKWSALIVAAVALSGLLWVWLATIVATRGKLLTALRED